MEEHHSRLAELMGAVSLASDGARGQAPESALGATILATRLAERMGLTGEGLAETYYTALTRTLGCTSISMDVAPLGLGDDLSLTYAMHMSDIVDPASVRAGLESHFAPTAAREARTRAIDRVLELHSEFPYMAAPIGQQVVALSTRLPLPPRVPHLLCHVDARWDGLNPTRSGGEDIPSAVRVVEFATVIELYRRAGGLEAARDIASDRSGGQFDPEVCALFDRDAAAVVEGFDQPSLWDVFLESEPPPISRVDEDALLAVAEVSADFADNKSGWFVGNSRRVAELALAAARHLGWSDERCRTVLLAGLFHDIGRCAVPNGIWDKPGPLTDREYALARSHSQHTEQILSVCQPLRSVARVAGAVHERRDGSGYHRGSTSCDQQAELIAAADVFVALMSDRPWRDAHPESVAVEILGREVDEGRLSASAVHAVLEVCGHRTATANESYPDGLTQREVEVLQLLARGLLTKQIAAKLGIAFKTVDNHVQNLYRKIGANTRTAAAMYAVENGIYSE